MNKKLIKDDYKKIKSNQIYNKNYYDKNKSLVSDQEYDHLKKEIILLEKNIVFLNLNFHHLKQ